MLFSCKITHSVISFLDRRGEDLDPFYDSCDWPAEFLLDPSSWLEADKMELVLGHLEKEYGRRVENETPFLVQVGHQCKDLRAWGVLDSVLRMVSSPKDFYAQPERFLSYFVSPAPPIGGLIREVQSVSFVLPISEIQFPLVTSYLRSALDALPSYIGKPMANVTWKNSHMTISWSENQESLLSQEEQEDLSLNPELVRNVLHDLETRQKELEVTKSALLEKEKEIERLKAALGDSRELGRNFTGAAVPIPTQTSLTPTGRFSAKELSQEQISKKSSFDSTLRGQTKDALHLVQEHPTPISISNPELNNEKKVEEVLHDLFRLGDYVARGQQLITLLIGQGRQTPQVIEAMRRVDWEFVAAEGPAVVKKAVAELQKLRSTP